MNRTRNFLIMFGVALLFVAVFFIMSTFSKEPQMAHDFYAGTHKGEVISLYDNIGKTPTALLFADPEVEGSNTVLSRLLEKKDSIDIIVVSVSKLEVEKQMELLPKGWDSIEKFCFEGSDAIEKYNIGNAPILYFIDKDGFVQDAFVAGIKETTLDKTIKKLS